MLKSPLILIAGLASCGLAWAQPANSDAMPTDPRTLEPAVRSFVEMHAAVSQWANQIARFTAVVCPKVTGLTPAFNTYLEYHITTLAREVGAPTVPDGEKCDVNVEVVFTPAPQQLLDHIVVDYRYLLGFFYEPQRAKVTTFSHPIQAWYVTGTQSLEFATLNHPLLNGDRGEGASGPGRVRVDSSRIHDRLRSEIEHVLIIADSNALNGKFAWQSVADYIGVLSLTRMTTVTRCASLPSIVDLLATDCGSPHRATAVTTADMALLKALYTADLEGRLNLEQSDLQGRMIQAIQQH